MESSHEVRRPHAPPRHRRRLLPRDPGHASVYEVTSVAPAAGQRDVAADVRPEIVFRKTAEGALTVYEEPEAEHFSLVTLPAYTPVPAKITEHEQGDTIRIVFAPRRPLPPGAYEMRHEAKTNLKLEGKGFRGRDDTSAPFDLAFHFSTAGHTPAGSDVGDAGMTPR